MEKRTAPYWLRGGTEACHACTHVYVYETGLRCSACDRGVCAQCAVVDRVQRITLCPSCSATEQEE